jgi:hypothetical protein
MFRRSKEVELFGRRFVMSDRLAMDVIKLDREREKAAGGDMMQNLFFIAVAVSDSLKGNKRRFWQKNVTSPQYLLDNCSVNELIELNKQLYELENAIPPDDSKKKT